MWMFYILLPVFFPNALQGNKYMNGLKTASESNWPEDCSKKKDTKSGSVLSAESNQWLQSYWPKVEPDHYSSSKRVVISTDGSAVILSMYFYQWSDYMWQCVCICLCCVCACMCINLHFPTHPAPTSNKLPVSWVSWWHRYKTSGATYSGFRAATSSAIDVIHKKLEHNY